MRLTVSAFGLALDISIGREQCELEYDEPEAGDALSTPLGFVPRNDTPDEAQLPDRYPWDD